MSNERFGLGKNFEIPDYGDMDRRRQLEGKRRAELENSRQTNENEEGLGDGSTLYFNPSAQRRVAEIMKMSEGSVRLSGIHHDIGEFVEYARRNGFIKSPEDLESLSLNDRISLAVYFFVVRKNEEKALNDRGGTSTIDPFYSTGIARRRAPAGLETKPSVALFVPTAERRRKIIDTLPRPIQEAVAFSIFSDANDLEKTNRSDKPGQQFSLVLDSGLKVFSGADSLGVQESLIGQASLADIHRRQGAGAEYVGLFNFGTSGLQDRYHQVPGVNYVRSMDDFEFSVLKGDIGGRYKELPQKERYTASATRHLKMLGALNEKGDVTETGKEVLRLSESLGVDLVRARIIVEGIKRGILANSLLVAEWARNVEPDEYIPYRESQAQEGLPQGKYYGDVLGRAFDWNKFLLRNDAPSKLKKLADARVPVKERCAILNSAVGRLPEGAAMAFIGMIENLGRLNGGDFEAVRNAAEIRVDVQDEEWQAFVSGYIGNLMRMEASWGAMLKEAGVVLLVINGGKEPILKEDVNLGGTRKEAEKFPFLLISINNRRLRQPHSYGKDKFDRNDPLVEAMKGLPATDTENIIGPILRVSPDTIKNVSPNAWAEVSLWYESEQSHRSESIAKNDPKALAGPSDLQSLADMFRRKGR